MLFYQQAIACFVLYSYVVVVVVVRGGGGGWSRLTREAVERVKQVKNCCF
jgi:hypothetical protein